MTQGINSPRLDNLPTLLSTFIGREHEIASLKQLLLQNRLVTLTGVGGSGKTRLAIKLANEVRDKFEQGIWFIEFAPLADDTLVLQIVATTLGIRERKNSPLLDDLIEHLQTHQSLLIFDNCEHLINTCAQLVEKMLIACPGLRILTTSREPLSLPGEVVWVVPPMTLPALQPWRDPTSGQSALLAYQKSEAVQLFLNRAALVAPDFQLTIENGAWVAEICRHLDGMPLAIELAAARVRALSVQQIAERLDDRFNLLTGGSRTAPPRQQTLEATLDWSYTLLSETESKVLQRLSVFSGGATLDAAETVCVGAGVDRGDVLDTSSQLVDKSLVIAGQRSGGTRYSLLETIRQYAREKLIESGEFAVTKDRHLHFFGNWAEMAEANLQRHDQPLWLDRFETEHDNLRAALVWSNSKEENIDAGLKLAAACGLFWRYRGHMNEGRMHLSTSLSRHGAHKKTILRAKALLMAGHIAYMQSDYPLVETLGEEALSLCRVLGEEGRQTLAQVLDLLGELATETGEHATASVYFQEALGIFRELNDDRGLGDMHMQIGWAFMRIGDLQQAKLNLEEAQSIFRKIGNQRFLGFTFSGLGEVAIRQEEYERAIHLLEQGLSLASQIEDKWLTAAMLGSQGWVALNQNDLTDMRKVLRESLSLRTELGDIGGIAWCLEKLANAAYLEKQFEKSVGILAAADALRAPINSVIDEADLPDYNRLLADLQSELGTGIFNAAWVEGRAKPLEDVIEEALTDSKETRQSEKEKYGGLSPREREVAVLIADGRTNREIAEAMTVRVKTVETYVTRILNKLGFDSRVQIATWAVDKGLK